jgi:hypothetical protein
MYKTFSKKTYSRGSSRKSLGPFTDPSQNSLFSKRTLHKIFIVKSDPSQNSEY